MCRDGQEWTDSQLIAEEGGDVCQLGECQDVECDPKKADKQCCNSSPHCVATMPLNKYTCQTTPPICLAPGALCRKYYINDDDEEVLPPTSEGDCCGLYCSYDDEVEPIKPISEQGVDLVLEYTCQEFQLFT